MSQCIFIGGAPAVAQVNTETPATVEISDIFTVKLENNAGDRHTISYTAVAATVKDVVEGLNALAVAAAAAATAPWNEVTCTEDDLKMTITGDVAGVPFWVTATAIDGGVADTQTLTDANTTAVAGPSIFATTENYLASAAPTNGDSIVIRPDVTTAIYGVSASAGDFIGFDWQAGSEMDIGGFGKALIFTLKSGGTYYNATLAGTGTAHLNISDYHRIDVENAGSPTDTVPWALNLTGTHDADDTSGRGTIQITAPSNTSVGIGANAGEDMEVNKVVVLGGATVEIGASVTENDDSAAPDIDIADGVVTCRCAVTTAIQGINRDLGGGNYYHEDAGALAALSVRKGITHYDSTGTLAAANVRGELDCTDNPGATITQLNLHEGFTYRDPNKAITNTNGMDFVQCGPEDGTLDIGNHMTLTRSAV